MKKIKSSVKSPDELSLDEVKHVANLAKLNLSGNELVEFRDQLSSIIHLVNQVAQVDTENIEPTSQVTGLENIFRDDNVDPARTLSQEDTLSNAKRKHNGYFMVDAVLE